MSDVTDQLAAAEVALTAAQSAVSQATNDLNNTATTPADNVLAAVVSTVSSEGLTTVFGADTLVNALEACGYSVTAPVKDIPVTDGTQDPSPTE